MNVHIAYTGIIMIWATTPLAIKWSSEGPGFLFGITSRMVIGFLCVLLLLVLMRSTIPLHDRARRTYLAGGAGIYGAMLCVYWGAQFIPSGWVSVVFGLSPLITAMFAALVLGEHTLTPVRIGAQCLGLTGLVIIFASSLDIGWQAMTGIAAVLASACIHAGSAVTIKKINADIPALASAAGSLFIAIPGYLLTWWLFDGQWPVTFSHKNLLAIFYLGIVATAGGFALYYYALKRLEATRVAMIALVSPALALSLGHWANQEVVSMKTLAGAACILIALCVHEIVAIRAAYNANTEPGQ